MVFLQVFAYQSYLDRTPTMIGIELRIVAQGIQVSQIFLDVLKGALFFTPVLGEVGLSTGNFAHSFKGSRGDRFFLCLPRADDVDKGAGGLGEFCNVLGRNRAGIVGAIRKDDDCLSPS